MPQLTEKLSKDAVEVIPMNYKIQCRQLHKAELGQYALGLFYWRVSKLKNINTSKKSNKKVIFHFFSFVASFTHLRIGQQAIITIGTL
jgi:hypothetical protein